MEINEREILMKAILDEQEKVRDFENHSKTIKDSEVKEVFKELAEQHGHNARQLHELLDRYE